MVLDRDCMQNSYMMKRKLGSLYILVTAFAFLSQPAAAVERTLVSNDGSTIVAELVSHNGGKVKIRRSDGKEFEVDPAIFCKKDREAISQWMAKTPELINYSFDVEMDKKKLDGVSSNDGYTRVKSSDWVYEISIKNRSKDTVNKLKVEYRVFFTNKADSGSYYYAVDASTQMVDGSLELKQDLAYNRTLVFSTDKVKIDMVTEYYGDRRKDELKGCLIRILDPAGNSLGEWTSAELWMKDKTWSATTPRKKGGGGAVIIR